jgi:hypothetical protein
VVIGKAFKARLSRQDFQGKAFKARLSRQGFQQGKAFKARLSTWRRVKRAQQDGRG